MIGLATQFDKQRFAELVDRARGGRSISQYASQSRVDAGYISRLIRGERPSPPSADVIRRLASAARGGVTVEDLMAAAGYLDVDPPRPLTPTEKIEELGGMLRSAGATEDDVKTIMELLESRRRLREAARQGDEKRKDEK